jgi:cytochrome P450
MSVPPPVPTPAAGRSALRAWLRGRSLLEPLVALQAELGDVFQLPLLMFRPVVVAGPEAARFVLVDARDSLRWRNETDPVTRLLRHGSLVEDGEAHARLRTLMTPAFHRALMLRQVEALWHSTDEVTRGWQDGLPLAVVPEMRRLTLLCLTRTLFGVDIAPDLAAIWHPLLRTLAYIGPGAWLLWPAMPRPGYAHALRQMDAYLFGLIAARRAQGVRGDDLLGLLVHSPLSDDLIRDQLLTLLIAGHDTVTAGLSWALYLLGQHPRTAAQARAEVDAVLGGEPPTADSLGQLRGLERFILETLRLYPPIHIGNRLAALDLDFAGHAIPAGTRVLFSIYLTHRHPRYWPEPDAFCPERFEPARRAALTPFTYLPFGGGPRFCIGAAMAQVELKVVLARLLQQFDLSTAAGQVRLRMGATLEPVGLRLHHRRRNRTGQSPSTWKR